MFLSLVFAACLSTSPGPKVRVIQPVHQKAVGVWLNANPGFRIALESDCGDCTEQIQMMRRETVGVWKPVPDYTPYYVAGDFNNDGENDFAIAVIKSKQKGKSFRLLVFNGPFTNQVEYKPVFVSEFMNLRGQGLFFGPPRPKPYRLLLGAFESEGILLVPNGQGYVWDRSNDDN